MPRFRLRRRDGRGRHEETGSDFVDRRPICGICWPSRRPRCVQVLPASLTCTVPSPMERSGRCSPRHFPRNNVRALTALTSQMAPMEPVGCIVGTMGFQCGRSRWSSTRRHFTAPIVEDIRLTATPAQARVRRRAVVQPCASAFRRKVFAS